MKKIPPSIIPSFIKYDWIVSVLVMILTIMASCPANALVIALNENTHTGKLVPSAPPQKQHLTLKIIPLEQNGYGCEILCFSPLQILQPELHENNRFKKIEGAERYTTRVINKISNIIKPHTVTKQEMDFLKIKF